QLPKEKDGIPLRHALEVRHPSCNVPAFLDLLTRYDATVVYAEDDAFPRIRHEESDFAVARLMQSKSGQPTGYPKAEIDRLAKTFTAWSRKQDVFVFFISGAKENNPAAATALLDRLGLAPATSGDADALAGGRGRAKSGPTAMPTKKKSAPSRAVAKKAVARKPAPRKKK
ncbi:MAG TPA: DUF72 domain-containing protein, partial [Hyphomonadaceae bacterium]|nr:DUF72 domain-containing protein [Hyphomonadaceae bacterium]